jgi:hypothetical protein
MSLMRLWTKHMCCSHFKHWSILRVRVLLQAWARGHHAACYAIHAPPLQQSELTLYAEAVAVGLAVAAEGVQRSACHHASRKWQQH